MSYVVVVVHTLLIGHYSIALFMLDLVHNSYIVIIYCQVLLGCTAVHLIVYICTGV